MLLPDPIIPTSATCRSATTDHPTRGLSAACPTPPAASAGPPDGHGGRIARVALDGPARRLSSRGPGRLAA